MSRPVDEPYDLLRNTRSAIIGRSGISATGALAIVREHAPGFEEMTVSVRDSRTAGYCPCA